ncbi:MAG: hypothetical protein GY757_30820 [bacterium]|nr:hypothetical protein [bacterium]
MSKKKNEKKEELICLLNQMEKEGKYTGPLMVHIGQGGVSAVEEYNVSKKKLI